MLLKSLLKKLILPVLIIPVFIPTNSFSQSDIELRFDKAATHFTQSLPLGNGRLGAMVFGNPNKERIVLNEISMWSGGIEDPNRKDAYQYLPAIQQLLKEEKNEEAQRLLQQHFTSAGKGSGSGNGSTVKFGCYQIFSDVFINWKDTSSAVSNYERTLNVETAVATTEWKRNNVNFKEEVWVSHPHQVVIIRLSSDKKQALNFEVLFNRKEKATYKASGNSIVLNGQLNGGEGDEGLLFAAELRALTDDGKVTALNDRLKVEGSKECVIIIAAATDMNWPNVEQRGPAPLPIVSATVKKAVKVPSEKLLKDHIKDYQSYFNRCRLYFDPKIQDKTPVRTTPGRLENYADGHADAQLPALYFNFGRYLLISSSRPGGLPANLQGLWAEEYQTPWNGDYHLNINLQMNYWPAEITNLGELHKPLIEFTSQLVEPGKRTAKAYYNSNGWTAHVISNPWKFTAPGESAQWGSTLTGGAWLSSHLWKHYSYSQDKEYLSSVYPVLKGASRFYADILIEDPKTKWLVTAPSNSPENAYITSDGFKGQITMGPTMDMQIGRELFENTIQAATILGIDNDFADSLAEIRKRLAPNQISKRYGGIQEWLRDYEDAEPQHRHVSQLYGLYPYHEINMLETPELASAAEKTLQLRGDESTGWSKAWKICFWARLGNGDKSLHLLKSLLLPAFSKSTSYNSGGGTYENLFCAHPPFQIDGNLGATAGIAEMLLLENGKNNVISLLPALPSDRDWATGSIKGVRAQNGFQLDFEWTNSKVTSATIYSLAGKTCKIQVPEGLTIYDESGKKIKASTEVDGSSYFSTRKGARYLLK